MNKCKLNLFKYCPQNVITLIFNDCSPTNLKKIKIVRMGASPTSPILYRFSSVLIKRTFHKWLNIQKQRRCWKWSFKHFLRNSSTTNFFKHRIEILPSFWSAVIENEGDYTFDDNIQINLTYSCFYILSIKM